MMKHFLLLHGPNLNLLGIREKNIYGTLTLAEIEKMVREKAAAHGVALECYQSNSEGALIDRIHAGYGNLDGILFNPGAYTHYSYALRDAISSVQIPTVEIHLSDIHNREEFRRISVIEPVCIKQISGQGAAGYLQAFDILLDL